MAYAITEYEFWSNPKVRRGGTALSMLLYIAGNGFCNQFLTNGVILDSDIETLSYNTKIKNPQREIAALVDSGLWERIEGGYQVHDYLDYYKAKNEVEELRSTRSEAGKKGGRPSNVENKTKANGKQNAFQNESKMKANEKQIGLQNESKTKPYNNNNNNNNIKPPISPTNLADDDRRMDGFFHAFVEETDLRPKPTSEHVQAICKLVDMGVSVEEYRVAIQEMLAAGYKCTNLASPYNWIVNIRNGDKKAAPKTAIFRDPDGNEVELAI